MLLRWDRNVSKKKCLFFFIKTKSSVSLLWPPRVWHTQRNARQQNFTIFPGLQCFITDEDHLVLTCKGGVSGSWSLQNCLTFLLTAVTNQINNYWQTLPTLMTVTLKALTIIEHFATMLHHLKYSHRGIKINFQLHFRMRFIMFRMRFTDKLAHRLCMYAQMFINAFVYNLHINAMQNVPSKEQ